MSPQDINEVLLHPYRILDSAELDLENVSKSIISQFRELQGDLDASRAENGRLHTRVESLEVESGKQVK